jgi:phosphoglucosamine mutase
VALFGSSGVRGIVNKEFTPELAAAIGMAVGGSIDRAAVGMDSRTSGPMIESALSAGLMACGCEVHQAGLVTTPTLAECARELDCGVMITASHNPPEYGGIKLVDPDGSGWAPEDADQIEKTILSAKFRTKPWDEVGTRHIITDAVERHVHRIMNGVNSVRHMTVVVDCANGPASTITPVVLQKMGCKVVTINSDPSGFFPGRPPEPVDENLTDLKSMVRSLKADLGIAHDGDADRMVAIDDKGIFLGGDQLMAIFAKRFCKKKADDTIDAEVTRTRVGDVFVSEEVKRSRADFGGEPSGTWIFPDQTFCPDGILAAARLVEIASEKKLSEQRKAIPVYPILRGAQSFKLEDKAKVLKCLESAMSSVKHVQLLRLDGYRLEFEDGWALVRPSGTEPKIRYLAEARQKKRADEIFEFVSKAVKRCVK